MTPDCDIAIIGGGPVGAALALALRLTGSGSRFNIALLEAGGARHSGARPIAVSHGSRQLLERLHAWDALDGTPIRTVHVSQRGSFGRVAMSADDAGVPALGHVVEYNTLTRALRGALAAQACIVIDGARVTQIRDDGPCTHLSYECGGAARLLTARLAVLADGGDIDGVAPPRVTDYGQSAITACVRTRQPHHNTAYERFTPEGPLALLPFGAGAGDFALVWTTSTARAEALMQLTDAEFLCALGAAFGTRLGDFTAFTAQGARACFPLALRVHARARGLITIGNAAQTLHPVAGQGFNLGLRDAWELAALIRTNADPGTDLGTAELARQFAARRRADRDVTIAATHGLVKLFSSDHLPAMRGAGMTLLAALPPLKDLLARHMMRGLRQ